MPIVKCNTKQVVKALKKFDWSKVDAMTDKDIARQIASNPDAAPDIAAELKKGTLRRPIKPEQIKDVRRKTGLSQSSFATRLHLNVATIRNWEQGRTRPDGAAIALLTVIDRAPEMAMRALQAT
jgi:putative transcriptional regulator